MKTNSRFIQGASKPVLSLGVILTLLGMGLWILQLIRGLGVTGLTQDAVWGMYIAGFFTAAGAGAGALALAGLMALNRDDTVDNREQYKLFSVALASFVSAGVLIVIDIGNVSHIFSMIFSFEYTSSMAQDFWALMICLVVAVIGLLKAKSGKTGLVFNVICILASLTLIITEGLMLSRVSAHAFWGSGTVAAFIISMIVAGCAVSLFVLKEEKNVFQVRKYLIIGLLASALLTLSELLTLTAASEASTGMELQSLLSGSASLAFWAYILAGLVIPLALLFKVQTPIGLKVSAFLAVFGVLAEKLWILIAGMEHPLVVIPGRGAYHISAVEFFTVVGISGLGVLAYVIISGLFDSPSLHQQEKVHFTP